MFIPLEEPQRDVTDLGVRGRADGAAQSLLRSKPEAFWRGHLLAVGAFPACSPSSDSAPSDEDAVVSGMVR